ncbi:peptide-methionine (R)-S-oxide reductase [Flavipsychrobacter stenotrophus]|uniref:peptide-methionine (R)-S-oxide reductase n=1 Tax=Flavipsychrobacter stenotrophus TaxID=2077091 RepID=A0A2S7T002_9BACT|nr:peptide-methionine (R)-S-oxide reductase MsrB [Flavipsychrobacter stenotrophus]PQJ12096.1 peptide-methionine (R)-S-oxide reductase [Flavipsychrobacter stenotrophus]
MKNAGVLLSFLILVFGVGPSYSQQTKNPYYSHADNGKLRVADAEWKKILPGNVYHILREAGTEAPNTGPFVHNPKKGTYHCAACGHALFSSATKFDSGTGWPSFYQVLNKNSVIENRDESLGVVRTEVVCERCGGHLGHVFDDGPKPTGLRYCMNGFALSFEAAK